MYANAASLTAEQRNQARTMFLRADFAIDYGPAAVYVREDASRIVAAGFIGKACKPAWHYAFKSLEAAGAYADKWAARIAASKAATAEHRAERAACQHTLQVGDVLVSTWGYEQTNVDYYQVTRLVGSTMVELRKIAQDKSADSYMSGECTPIPGHFIGAALTVKVKPGNAARIKHAYATPAQFVEVAGVRMYSPNRFTCYA